MRAQAGLPDASDSVHSAVRKLLARELSRVRAYEAGTRAGVDPEALHRMRTALRRARAALRVFEAGGPHRTRKSLAAELRWLAARLGEVRDLDVQLQALAASDERLSATQRRALQPYRTHLLAERERHRAVLLQALASERYQALLTSLEAFTADTT